jgi:hypothetical protein
MNLDAWVGRSINDICGNGFHDPAANHCAHFVCHVLGLGFPYNCRQFVGGTAPAANIRVHEVFAECPKVGKWADADKDRMQLVFVVRKDVVNLAAKTMQNIPQKHVGIYSGGKVYHYSNANDRVVVQGVDEFFQRFQNLYAGDQGLFFGRVPGSSLQLSVDLTAASVPAGVRAFQLRKDGARWWAKLAGAPAGAEFLAGVEVMQPAKGFYGLHFPASAYYGPVFDPADHVAAIDQWAYLLDVTAACESKGRMNLINTYDRARFTFGFYQLAAHTPRDNLILYFRAALADPGFRRLFPDLELRGGKVFRLAGDGSATDLEEEAYDPASGEHQLRRFMAYLNPNRTAIDDQEVLQAARMVWWANENPVANRLQAQVASQILQKKVTQRYQPWYGLDGRLDTTCAIVADIHHQGRGGRAAVKAALSAGSEVQVESALLAIGAAKYPTRVATLKARLDAWRLAGKMGQKRYHAGLNEFR